MSRLWKKGISGTALEFDGYNTLVTLPAAKAPNLAAGGIGSAGEKVGTGNLTLEGWFVLGAYPWNWVPVVQQGDDNGYFLGVDSAGNAIDYNWNPDPPKPDYKGKKIQKIYFTGQYDPFTIQNFTGGDVYKGERTWYSVTPSWNHWPTAQVNSSGRNSSFPDRAAHSSISHLFWPNSFQQRGNVSFDEKILLEGMTNQSAASLTNLANSWLKAPVVINVTGSISKGYNQIQRAYEFTSSGSKLSFSINASSSNPICNLCFVIKNWGNRTSKALLSINKVSQSAGPDFRQGILIDTDGTYSMIIWVGLTATTLQSFEITKK